MRRHQYLVSTLPHRTSKNSEVLLSRGTAFPAQLFNTRRLATFVSKAVDNVAEKITVRESMERLGLKT